MRDSAGVSIVENRVPKDPPVILETSPTLAVSIGAADGDEGERLHRVQDALRLPDGRLAVLNASVHVTHDGGAWIGVPVPPGSAPEGNDGKTAYDVFGPDGRWRGRALAEQRVRPLEIGETYLLGLREDELGVQHVELYGLGPPSGDVSSDSGAARPSR